MEKISKKSLKELGIKIVKEIEAGKNPSMDIPIRTLSNVIYDSKTKMITLGNKIAKRYFFNVAHVRKFTQTAEVAALAKDLLEANKHMSLREVFYAMRRTLPNSNIDIVDEQNESLAPDEPILVRLNGVMKFMNGEELLKYAKLYGKKLYDDGKKEKYYINSLKVCAFDQNYQIRETPVNHLIKHPPNIVKKIITSSGKNVKVTLSHSLFISRQGLPTPIEVKNLNVGDWIAIPRKINVNSKTKQIDLVKKLALNCPENILSLIRLKGNKNVLSKILNEIKKDDLRKFVKQCYNSSVSCTLGNWRKSSIPLKLIRDLNLDLSKYYNELKITCRGSKHKYNCLINCDKNLGIVFGFLISEGSHSIGKRNGERNVSISNKKKNLIEIFANSFRKCFGESPAGKIILSKDGTFRLNVGYDLLSYILEYCLEYKPMHSWEKYLPSFLFDCNEEVLFNFIKWYRLGDGSICDKTAKLISFHTSSLSLVNGIVFLLLRLGIISRIYKSEPRNSNSHDRYEIRVGNREDVIKLSKITGDFYDKNINKKINFSSDRIPDIGELVRNNLDKLKLNDDAYRKFNWYAWSKQETVCRTSLANSNIILSQFGEVDETLKIVSNYDISWDKIISIEDAETPPYTIDLSVSPMQNFIGGNGLIILHNSNKAVEDLELITDLLREQLHINANKLGAAAGRVIIKDKGDLIDWSKLGSGGWSIPSNVEDLEFKKVDAKFVIYMEKAAIWERLHEDKLWDKLKCAIIASQGQATRGIRRLLQRMSTELGLPIYVLTDFDPWGIYIYSVLKTGSISLAHISERLAIPNSKFLGLTGDDIVKYDLKRHIIKFKDVDLKRLKELSKYEWFKNKKEWQRQFKLMQELNGKVELDALVTKGITFISDKYIPTKIKEQDWLD
ncbi:MAG: LAGLIDADG family homing endonuclease [Candidatus Aenigmatarchaeota archaeon]